MVESFVKVNEVKRIASTVLSEEIVTVVPLHVGVMTHKFIIESFDKNIYIIRFYPKAIQYVINYEPELFKRSKKNGALVPKVIFDSRMSDSKYHFIIYKMIKGQSLSDKIGAMAYQELGQIVDQIHHNLLILRELKFDGYGPLATSTKAEFASWGDFLDQSINEGLAYISLFGLTSTQRKLLNSYVISTRATLRDNKVISEFIWSDISTENIIIEDELSGFVDFEGVMSGSTALEMSYLFAKEGSSDFFKLMYDRYSSVEVIQENELYFYTILRVLRIAKYLSHPLPTGHPRDSLKDIFPGFSEVISNL
jgi:Ser/Thr protein kinase RdoA (MazF antagonist)